MIQSIVLSHDLIYRVNVVIRNEPLTGKFSYTIWDAETGTKNAVQTQFTDFEDAAKAAASSVREAIANSAKKAELRLIEEFTRLWPQK
jgi:hypothetical protein